MYHVLECLPFILLLLAAAPVLRGRVFVSVDVGACNNLF